MQGQSMETALNVPGQSINMRESYRSGPELPLGLLDCCCREVLYLLCTSYLVVAP